MTPSERMTPDELRATRKAFNLSGARLAQLLDVRADTIRKWEGGRDPIPYGVPTNLMRVGDDLIEDISEEIDSLENRWGESD